MGNISLAKKQVTAFVICLCSFEPVLNFLTWLTDALIVNWPVAPPSFFPLLHVALYSCGWSFFKWVSKLLVLPHLAVTSLSWESRSRMADCSCREQNQSWTWCSFSEQVAKLKCCLRNLNCLDLAILKLATWKRNSQTWRLFRKFRIIMLLLHSYRGMITLPS